MSNAPSVTRAQFNFFRAFRTSAAGPTPDQWPSPAILRRWLRKPTFRRALLSLIQTLRFQADFTLAAAATSASQSLASPAESDKQIARLSALLRLSHMRQRFAAGKARRDDDEELPDLEEIEDAKDSDRALELAQQAISILPPEDRLTMEEFDELAQRYKYIAGLNNYEVFPPPPPRDSVYHDILANPRTLLAFLSRVNKTDPQKRYSYIIEQCRSRVCDDNFLPPIAP